MSIDQRHVALPKLYGGPAYARPPVPVAATPRPFDPDELPLASHQADDDRESKAYIVARAYETGGAGHGPLESGGSDAGGLRPRPFSLRAIAGRLLGGD